MANIKITELNSELMTEAIANAQARRNNFISELSEEQAAEVLGGKFALPIYAGFQHWPPYIGIIEIDPNQQSTSIKKAFA
ncbi:MAG: hypothetical protein F6K54_37755 [Okeania sp. SIO3B5]|uniref:hypothetical protein n=1 Tax=Okeania sp. SIO3B5 TaxID=2607811 RepID=UPI0013FFE50F|nr:hypothetical protein [Okeania sp. SIO3B5]NEO58292.1 hypothetical protein [Okeania sp. SIO3B5]